MQCNAILFFGEKKEKREYEGKHHISLSLSIYLSLSLSLSLSPSLSPSTSFINQLSQLFPTVSGFLIHCDSSKLSDLNRTDAMHVQPMNYYSNAADAMAASRSVPPCCCSCNTADDDASHIYNTYQSTGDILSVVRTNLSFFRSLHQPSDVALVAAASAEI